MHPNAVLSSRPVKDSFNAVREGEALLLSITYLFRKALKATVCTCLVAGAAAWGQQSACDLNSDGQVNSPDVQIAVNQSNGTFACTNGDLDRDGSCTAADVTRVTNAVLGQGCVVGPGGAPAITSLNPSQINAAGPATTFLINGTGFAQEAQVLWNGAPLTTTWVSANATTAQLRANLSAAQIALAGVSNVQVQNPTGSPTGGSSFQVRPVLTSISPNVFVKGASNTYTANGGGFGPNAVLDCSCPPNPGTLPLSSRTTSQLSGSFSFLGVNPGVWSVAVLSHLNPPLTTSASLPITVQGPSIGPSQSTLTFQYQQGGAAPAPQSLNLSSNGLGISYSATGSGGAWLPANLGSGSTPGVVNVAVSTAGLSPGVYNGTITVTGTYSDPNLGGVPTAAHNSPLTIPVTLTVTATPPLTVSCNPSNGPSVAATPYSTTCTASGGIAPYNWSVLGTLPAGLSLSGTTGPTVTISGSPSVVPAYNFSIRATDNSIPTLSAQKSFSGVISACAYSVSPASSSFGAAGGPGSVNVSATAGCNWTAGSPDPWVTFSGPATGTGSGTLNYTVAANTNGQGRNTTLTIAGLPFLITQAGRGCVSTITPTSATVNSLAGNYSINLTMSNPDCPWSAASGVNWATVPVSGGSGSATVTYSVGANSSPNSRSGVLTIAGTPFSLRQSGTDCSGITLGQGSQSFTPAGGSGIVTVSAPAGCPYTVASNAGFVVIDSSLSGNGPGQVRFTVLPNPGFTTRSGSLTIAGQPFFVTQAGNVSPSISCTLQNIPSPALLRSSGRAELLSDLELLCSGQTGGSFLFGDIVLTLDGAFTSRITQTQGERTEAVLSLIGGGTVAGQVDGPNSVRFPGVPFSSGEREISVRMKISQVRCDPTLQGASALGTPIRGVVSVTAPITIPVTNSPAVLGFSLDAIAFLRGATRDGEGASQKVLPVSFQEKFATAYKSRESEGGTGTADLPTRLRLRLRDLPLSAQVFAPVSSASGQVRLMLANSDGTGGTPAIGAPRAGGSYAQLPVSAGETFAVWEVTSASAGIDTLDFLMLIENISTNDVAAVKVEGTLAPISDVATASATAPIPRFLDIGRPLPLVNLRITTNAPQRARVGDSITLSYRVKNDSDLPAGGVVVRNALADGLSNPSCTPNCTTGSTGLRFALGSVPAGSESTVTVTAAVSGVPTCPNCTDPGDGSGGGTGGGGSGGTGISNCPNCLGNGSLLVNTATVSGEQADPDLVNNVSQTTIELEEPCAVRLSRTLLSVAAAGGEARVDVATGPACEWTVPATTGVSTSLQGVVRGSAALALTVGANTTSAERRIPLAIGGNNVTLVQPAQGCTFRLTTPSLSVVATGGGGSLQINTGGSCTWTALSLTDWLRFTTSQPTGTGSAMLPFTIQPNPSIISRVAAIEVGGQVLRITQSAVSGAVVPPTSGLRFVPLEPCRVMETRPEYNFQGRTGSFGPPYMRSGETRTLVLPNSNVCSIPASAKAYVLNVTLVPRGSLDFVTVWPAGEPRPDVWTARSPDGQIVANSAIIKAGNGIGVYTSNDSDIILDIAGYFTDASAAGTSLTYYSLTPCRVIDTRIVYRSPPGPFGPPTMEPRQTRSFRFPATPYCPVPTGAAAYSVTITVAPPQPLQFLTAWPSGGSQPNVSSMNSAAGRTLANNVILPASSDGSIDVFVFDRTDVLIDINGYFAPDNGSGLYYFPITQCRAADTRLANGPLGGPILENEAARTIPIRSACGGLPASAAAYAVNTTALPGGSPMPFLTLWPTGQGRPNASILNAFEGQIATNFAIIPAGANGSIDLFAYRRTHVVLELNGYFGR